MESSEEIYSKSIIKNILDELVEDVNEEEYGLCELYLDAELQVYKKAFPSLNMVLVEDIVREYLYHHNYLEYITTIKGDCNYDFNEHNIYVKLIDDMGGKYDNSIDVNGLIVDINNKGLVMGLELLDGNEFLGLEDDENVDWCVVKVDYGIDVVNVNCSFYIVREGEKYGRLRQWLGCFINSFDGLSDFVGCRFIYK